MASVAVVTAVSNPKVTSVPKTSLSMVLGTPTTGRPFCQRSCAMRRLPSPPIDTSASNPLARKAAIRSSERSTSAVEPSACGRGPAERVAAVGGAEDGAAEVGDAADGGGIQRHDPVVAEQAAEPAPDAVALPAALVRGEHHGPDDGVEPGGVAAAGGDGDAHAGQASASRTRRRTSPGSAWRRSAFFEKISRPSIVTSNTPPDDSRSCTSASGYASCSSAARPAARGR